MKKQQSKLFKIAVAGLHLKGEPLNYQLTELGAIFHSNEQTAPNYKMFLIKGGKLDKPGLARVSKEALGNSYHIELWEMPITAVGDFINLIPHPLGIGNIELKDKTWVKGFICEPNVIFDDIDISNYSSWINYIEERNTNLDHD